jgi:hypothetical protein
MKKNFLECTTSLINSINAVISMNRCSFSTENLILLQDCILKLEQIKSDSYGSFEDRRETFVEIVVKLDKFFCTGKYLQELFNVFG